MTAPERFADSQIPLAPRAPSIHDPVGAGFIQTLTRPGGLAPLLPANPDTAPVLRATVGR